MEDRGVDEMRGFIGTAGAKLYRLFASDRNTRISQQLVVMLLAVTLMGTVMYALFDVARIVRPVARVEAMLGLHIWHHGGRGSSVAGRIDAP